MKNLLIVESPAKAKTIAKYLGGDFVVKSSVGHIRQIPKGGQQIDIKNNFKTTYEVDPSKNRVVSELKSAAKGKEVWLATDPDREGEAIAWHLREVLKLPASVKRVVYQEITQGAVAEAVANPRQIDMNLVSAQQTRQKLDRIVGYELSPVVWRKVPGGKSAGRVQSPALRLIVEREVDIREFASDFNFKISGVFTKGKEQVKATATQTPTNEKEAVGILKELIGAEFSVGDVIQNPGKRSPSAPFTTSTLQQAANSKFGWGAKTTMSTAQRLYQAGLITYMRTDSVNLSKQFLAASADYIKKNYGDDYHQFRTYATKNANAQEAHEAIRPTNVTKESAGASDLEKKLYGFIRARALATQMADATLEKTTVQILNDKSRLIFEAKGEVIMFPGFLLAYGETSKAKPSTSRGASGAWDSGEEILPALTKGDILQAQDITARQTFSKPPARFSEGSLVKELESLGIGRPSTYATILENIQVRGYVKKGVGEGAEREVIELKLQPTDPVTTRKRDGEGFINNIQKNIVNEKTGADKGKLVPTDVGEVLCNFLVENFDHVMDYGWTARVEKRLDMIAAGEMNELEMLSSFYAPFHAEVEKSADVDRSKVASSRKLGTDPKTKKSIYARVARYGAVIQLGEAGPKSSASSEKPTFIPMPSSLSVAEITLAQALAELAKPQLPRTIGTAKDGVELIASKGPFGFYIKAGEVNVTMPKDVDPFKITLEEAEKLYKTKLASIIADWGDVKILKGKYGPYVKGPGRWNNVRIPKDVDAKKLTEAEAKKLLDDKPKTKRAPRRKKK